MLILIIGANFSLNAQEANLTTLFAESICSKGISSAWGFLNFDMKNDSTESIINNIKESIGDAKDIKCYIVKLNAKVPVYNINIYDSITKKQYGDLRISFDKENLINRVMFFKNIERKKDLKSLFPLSQSPPPPTKYSACR